jgi:hypothetical protein
MGVLKNLFAFFIGMALVLFFYYYLRIPIIPAVSIYAISNLFKNDSKRSRVVFIIIATFLSTTLYTLNAFGLFKERSLLSAVFEFITACAILGAGILNCWAHKEFKDL